MTKPIRFRVAIESPHRHIVRMEMTIRGLEDEAYVDVAMPVWTPGSYLVREYSRFVQSIRAVDPDSDRRAVAKQDKARWRIDAMGARELTVHYDVYAHDLNPRFSHVEGTHAFLHGPALFLYPVDRLSDAIEVIVEVPDGWRVWTGLKRMEGPTAFYEARDFDELFDCPILAGDLPEIEFEANGVPHSYVMCGGGNYEPERLAEDTPRIIEASASIFGGELPYERFHFLTLLSQSDYGGLEHRNSTVLMYPRHEFRDPKAKEQPDEKYLDFLSLVSHEHFHVWNVKRIRPERLGPFDYQNENYTRDLWTVEGITSYYQWVSLLRAGIIDGAKFLEKFAEMIRDLERTPGRRKCSLEQASFDTWIKLYRPHPNNRNANVSYYLKGALASMALDVMIRVDTAGERSLDDVMRHLWFQYSKEKGYPEGGYAAIVREVVGNEVDEFFDTFVRSTADPDWNDWLENIGLSVVRTVEPGTPPYFGFDADKDATIKAVDTESPAENGLYPDDRVIAVDGWEAAGRLDALLAGTRANAPVTFHVMRRGQLVEVPITPVDPRPGKYELRRRDDADPRAVALLHQWLGTTEIDGEEE